MDRFVVRNKRKNEKSVDEAVGEQNIEKTSAPPLETIAHGAFSDAHVGAGAANSENPPAAKNSSVPSVFKNWTKNNPWLQLNKNNKGICQICTEVCERKLIVTFDRQAMKSKKAWVEDGFSNWKHGAERIRTHATSSFHITCTEALKSVKTINVVQSLSSFQLKQMMDSRTALLKIFSTLKALARQGLPIRGSNNDENSNFMTFLRARSEDVAELKNWLKRDGYKWLHHDNQNEILELMATTVLSDIMKEIKTAEYFSILLDETCDVSQTEQVSICLRVVSENLKTNEYFIGFFSTDNTKAETLFDLVKDVLVKHGLPLSKLRGQCYDGASNVSGKISGLQARIRKEEPRALFVHCNAHNLNLAVQDGIEKVSAARKFIGIMKDLINFVRDSPKRCAQFKELQNEEEKETEKLPTLSPYCPTRWVVRIKSLRSIKANYKQLMQFFYDRSIDTGIDSMISAKASGFYDYLQKFDCYFQLTMLIEIFHRVEILNAELQKSDLCVIESYEKIEAVADILGASRDEKFKEIWCKSNQAVADLDLDEPILPRQHKTPKRLDQSNNVSLKFKTPEEFFRKVYFEVYDQLLASLRSRFDNNAANFFKLLEKFTLGLGHVTDPDEIAKFYKSDFDIEMLLSDRDMFLQLLTRQNEQAKNLREVVEFLKKYDWTRGLIPEFVRFVRLLLTIPGSSCSNERSFSFLRRLKTYLRSTMLQDRLNHIAILHVYCDITDKLDLDEMLNTFISRNAKRTTVFAMSK